MNSELREYRPFVPACRKRGFGKTLAYRYAKEGLLETFTIGKKRYVYLDSLLTLPTRLAQAANDSGDLPPMDGAK
jgi:hypothetical protein